MRKLTVHSLQKLIETLKELENNKGLSITLLFTGSKDETGKSWCGDCNTADPIIEHVSNYNKYNGDDFLLITAFVGERNVWKDQQNQFRTHKDFRVNCVPTLLKWGTSIRLEESKCADKNLVEMLFDE